MTSLLLCKYKKYVSCRSSRRRCSVRKGFSGISQNSQENTYATASFLINNFIKKEALLQVFFCKFREISKDTIFTEHLRATASRLEVALKLYFTRSLYVVIILLFTGLCRLRRPHRRRGKGGEASCALFFKK